MNPSEIVFAAMAVLVLGGAGCAVLLKNVYHNALGLGLALFGIAGLYLYLDAEFLAVMQVIIYVGAISVAILFAIMLSRPMALPQETAPRVRTFGAAVAAIALFAAIAAILLKTAWPRVAGASVDIARIGRLLLTENLLAFEAVSVLLLIAIIGAIVISHKEDARP